MLFRSRAILAVLTAFRRGLVVSGIAMYFVAAPAQSQTFPFERVSLVTTLSTPSYSLEAGESTTFQAMYELVVTPATSFFWGEGGLYHAVINFGDGTTAEDAFLHPAQLGGSFFEHTYAAPGTYHPFIETFISGSIANGLLENPFVDTFPISLTNIAITVEPIQVAAAIPEPETYAMLLTGLALLGFATRRRQRTTAAA